jgi:hypothetical protein
MREGTQPGEKASILSLNFEIDEVPKLQDGVSCPVKAVVGTDVFTAENEGDGVFVPGFSYPQYEPFDGAPLFCLIIVIFGLKTLYISPSWGIATMLLI